uniref:Uncharacterized protein n=1 Tax=mine drainage metagenome TaxID=410659 RepID=E6PML5_9ZZZZ
MHSSGFFGRRNHGPRAMPHDPQYSRRIRPLRNPPVQHGSIPKKPEDPVREPAAASEQDKSATTQ